ncbi:hypothetical protein ACWGAN_30525 [Streptomyces sp. NPDC054945]
MSTPSTVSDRRSPPYERCRWVKVSGRTAGWAHMVSRRRRARGVIPGGPGAGGRRGAVDGTGVLGTEGAGEDEVVGCLYIYPAKEDPRRVHVSSWVRADRAALDKVLYEAVTNWLGEAWPFEAERIDYAAR